MAKVTANIRFKMYPVPYAALKNQTAREASIRGGESLKRRVQQQIRASGRVRTGDMIRSIQAEQPRSSNYRTTVRVGSSLDYTDFQNRGIGPVRPVRAKRLVFKPKGSSQFVFARQTRGFAGARFYEKALAQMRASDFTK